MLLIFQLNLRVSNAMEFGLCAYVEEAAEEESSPQVKVDHIYLSESNVWGHKSSSKGRCVFMCLLYHYYYYIYNTFALIPSLVKYVVLVNLFSRHFSHFLLAI